MDFKAATRFCVHAALMWFFFVPAGRAEETVSIAGTLVVYLRADHLEQGDSVWISEPEAAAGSDFVRIGSPGRTTIHGAAAVQFNSTGGGDAWQSLSPPPAGLVEPDADRTVEVWVYNETVSEMETILSWGHRGGPPGSNMGFLYGSDRAVGAVSHWGVNDYDLGWERAIPEKALWHHLVYTYDGSVVRVYCDGGEYGARPLGPGMLDTHDDAPITLAGQTDPDGTLVNAVRGSLAIGRVRIHDGVLTSEEVKRNYELEREEFPLPFSVPIFVNAPGANDFFSEAPAGPSPYVRLLNVKGAPQPLSVRVLSPAGAVLTQRDETSFLLSYEVPPGAGSVKVALEAENASGDATAAGWNVYPRTPPSPEGLHIADELLVHLDAADITAGKPFWLNHGTLCDFARVGRPVVETVESVQAVRFNAGAELDAYLCMEEAPESLTAPDAPRSVEVWAHNSGVASEETMVAWGHAGGPAGTNCSFNYGSSAAWGAVSHWEMADLAWQNGAAPEALQWHYLVYTFDGETTRIYVDGILNNIERVGPGMIDSHEGTPVAIGVQFEDEKRRFHTAVRGSLSIAQVRVHAGVLSSEEIRENFVLEKELFPLQHSSPAIIAYPEKSGSFIAGDSHYTAQIFFTGFPIPSFEILKPASGASITSDGLFVYPLADPQPDNFRVRVRAFSELGEDIVYWHVWRRDPEMLKAPPVHRYTFDGNVRDVRGGADGEVVGAPDAYEFRDGSLVLLNDGSQLSGDPSAGAYVDLPNGIISLLSSGVTFECWAAWHGGAPGQRIFDFGTSADGEDAASAVSAASDYCFLTPSSSTYTLSLTMNNGSEAGILNEKKLEFHALPGDGSLHHIAFTWNSIVGSTYLYLDGKKIAGSDDTGVNFAHLDDVNNWLGRSQWAVHALYCGGFHEFRIYDYCLSDDQMAGNYLAGPDLVNFVEETYVPVFIGDTNGDGVVNIADAVCILAYRFAGGAPFPCMQSGDVNDDVSVNVTDALAILRFLFSDGCFIAPNGAIIEPGMEGCVEYREKHMVLSCETPCELAR